MATPKFPDRAGVSVYPGDKVLWTPAAGPELRAVVYVILPDGMVQLDREGGGADADIFAHHSELLVEESYIGQLRAATTKEALAALVKAAEFLVLAPKKKRAAKVKSGKSEKETAAEAPVEMEEA